MVINQYGQQARSHWRHFLPERYAALPDPIAYFTALGESVETQVGELWDRLIIADVAPPEETHLERVARLRGLKTRAEFEVLQELVHLEPEPDATPHGEDDGLESDAQFQARINALYADLEAISSTADALLDGTTTLADLGDQQVRALIDYMTPSFLHLLGTTRQDLRAQGRDV
ncbi:hypothetical protein ABTY61_32360 [Kitasatospora sp. NPDC096128]|uniref:hypothetical protein n=1 Tax=Kitasatospora sp. NPDC096128 TaxID=3155547 RepID=UPI0033219CDB